MKYLVGNAGEWENLNIAFANVGRYPRNGRGELSGGLVWTRLCKKQPLSQLVP